AGRIGDESEFAHRRNGHRLHEDPASEPHRGLQYGADVVDGDRTFEADGPRALDEFAALLQRCDDAGRRRCFDLKETGRSPWCKLPTEERAIKITAGGG